MKKLESGRSMVEMLGVLAIIGVLSVGGIAGYTLSMRRHRANGVADLVSKYALILYGQCQQSILNGESSDVADCGNRTNKILFANAGVGDLPSGVKSISYKKFETNSATGMDIVSINVGFIDSKLCQALGSITGTGCSENSVTVNINQN